MGHRGRLQLITLAMALPWAFVEAGWAADLQRKALERLDVTAASPIESLDAPSDLSNEDLSTSASLLGATWDNSFPSQEGQWGGLTVSASDRNPPRLRHPSQEGRTRHIIKSRSKQTSELDSRKADADRLLNEGIEQYNRSDWRTAVATWQQALAIYQEVVPNV